MQHCTNILSVSQVIFEHEGVFIHPSSEEDGVEPDLLISGTLRIVDKVTSPGYFIPCFCHKFQLKVLVSLLLDLNVWDPQIIQLCSKEDIISK